MNQTEDLTRDDDRLFVPLTISRTELRDICGPTTTDRLSKADRPRLADDMAEYNCDAHSVEALRGAIEQKFSGSAEQ